MKNYLVNLGLEESLIDIVLSAKKYNRVKGYTFLERHNKEILEKLYLEYKMPIYKIAMLSGVSDGTLRQDLINLDIPLKGHRIGKNSDCTFFSKIDTKEKAYYLGFIFADGSITNLSTETKQKKRLSLTITEGDKYLLQNFLIFSKIETPIHITHKDDKKPRAQVNITSLQIVEDLEKLGVTYNKSDIKCVWNIPNLPSNLIHHFIRGYFDGDGIGYSDGRLGFCGNKQMLEFIQAFLKNKINGNPSITFNESNNIYYLTYGKKDAKIISNILYEDSDNLRLERKYNIYRPL